MKRALLISALLCASAIAAPTVPELVKQLETGGWAERQSAEDALAAMGGSARDQIKAALQRTNDVETRERLQSALTRIERNQLLDATPVTLKGRFERPIDAFTKVAEQMGLKVRAENDAAMARATAAVPIELAMENVSWIPALSELTARTSIFIRIDDDAIVLNEQPPSVTRKPMHVVGAMTVIADSTRKRQSMQLFDNSITSGSTTLNLAFQAEPKLRFSGNRLVFKLDSLIDDAGNAVLPEIPRVMNASGGSGGRLNVGIPLGQPDKLPARLSRITGEIEGELIVRTAEVRIDDLGSLPETVSVQDSEIQVLSMTREGQAWIIKLKTPQPIRGGVVIAAGMSTYGGQPSPLSGLVIHDTEGRSLRFTVEPVRPVKTDATISHIQVIPVDQESAPLRMIWTVPAQTREVRIPFELRDLDLPR